MSFTVAKVGGSLFGLPDFKIRLQTWIARQDSDRILLVPGGGRLVDVVRRMDQMHQIGDEPAHWLAIEAMCVNALMMSSLVYGVVVRSIDEAEAAWSRGQTAVLDPRQFCRDDAHESGLPHNWQITSDSIAARVAVKWQAAQLILLKSAAPPKAVEDWAAAGYCDPWLTRVLAGSSVAISAVNLREMPS